MKTRILTLIVLISIGSLASCGGDDEPSVNPLIGEWELENITVTDPPASFSNMNGAEFSSLYGESKYTFIFNTDLTYSREIDNSIFGDLDDDGTWEQNENELILTFEDGDEGFHTDFELIGEIGERKMNLLTSDRVRALSDAILNDPQFNDTIKTQDEFNKVFDSLSVAIDVKLELKFDRQ